MDTPGMTIHRLPQEILNGIERKLLDVPYANQSDAQKMDIYYPASGEGPFPVIVHFHGGAFLFGTRRDINLIPMLRALERGYMLVSVEYRLSGEARFPALVYDCKAAIRYLRAHAQELGVDPERIAAWGPSAGGYLAAMIGTTGGNPAFEDLSMGNSAYSSSVQAVVDWCGPAGDFCLMDAQIRAQGIGMDDHDDPLSPESRLMGCAIQEVPQLCRLAAPATHVHQDVPPFLIHHGEADGTVPCAQSLMLAEAIRRSAGDDRVTLHTFPGRGHHGEPWYDEPAMTDEVFEFLDRHLKHRL